MGEDAMMVTAAIGECGASVEVDGDFSAEAVADYLSRVSETVIHMYSSLPTEPVGE
jgi:hypothetical protein